MKPLLFLCNVISVLDSLCQWSIFSKVPLHPSLDAGKIRINLHVLDSPWDDFPDHRRISVNVCMVKIAASGLLKRVPGRIF
jgi:hypothetical protein